MPIHRFLHSLRVFALIALYRSPLQRCFFDEMDELSPLLGDARRPLTSGDWEVTGLESHFKKPEFGSEHAQHSGRQILAAIHGQDLVPPVGRHSQIIAQDTQAEGAFQYPAHQRSFHTKARSPKANRQAVADPSWEHFDSALLNAPDDVLKPHRLDTPGNPSIESSMAVEESLGHLAPLAPHPHSQPRHALASTEEEYGLISRENSLIPENLIYPMTESYQILGHSANLLEEPASGSNSQGPFLQQPQDDFSDVAHYVSSIMGWDTLACWENLKSPYSGDLPQESENQPAALNSPPSPVWCFDSNDNPMTIDQTSGIVPSKHSPYPQIFEMKYHQAEDQAEDQNVLSTQARRATELNWCHSSDKTCHRVNTPLCLLKSSQAVSNEVPSSISSEAAQSSITRMERLEDNTIPTSFYSFPSHSGDAWLPDCGLSPSSSPPNSVKHLDHSASDTFLISHPLATDCNFVKVDQHSETQSQPFRELAEYLNTDTRGQPPVKKIRLLSGHGISEYKNQGEASDSLDFILVDPGLRSGQKFEAKEKLDQVLEMIRSDFSHAAEPNLPSGLLGVPKDQVPRFLEAVTRQNFGQKIKNLIGFTSHRRKFSRVEQHHAILAKREFEYLLIQEDQKTLLGSTGGAMEARPHPITNLNEDDHVLNLTQAAYLSQYQGELLEAMKRALVYVRMVSIIFKDSTNVADSSTHRLDSWNFFRRLCMKAVLDIKTKHENRDAVAADSLYMLDVLDNSLSPSAIKKISIKLLTVWLEQCRPELFKVLEMVDRWYQELFLQMYAQSN